MRDLEGADGNSKIAEFIKQLKEKDALIMERDAMLEELGNKNNLLDDEKTELKRQLGRLERRNTVSRGGVYSSQKTRSRIRPSETNVAGGASTEELDTAKAEITKVKDQNSDLKS